MDRFKRGEVWLQFTYRGREVQFECISEGMGCDGVISVIVEASVLPKGIHRWWHRCLAAQPRRQDRDRMLVSS